MDQQKEEKDKVSYAKALKEFVHPLVHAEDDTTILNKKYAFGVHVWNAQAMRESFPERFEQAKTQVIKKAEDGVEAEHLFNRLLEFKEAEFSAFDRVIIDFEVLGETGEDYNLSVASAALKK